MMHHADLLTSLKLEDFIDGDFKSETKANNNFFDKNKDLLMKIFNGNWILVMNGGRIIKDYKTYDELYHGEIMCDPKYQGHHKLCWKMASDEELRKDPALRLF